MERRAGGEVGALDRTTSSQPSRAASTRSSSRRRRRRSPPRALGSHRRNVNRQDGRIDCAVYGEGHRLERPGGRGRRAEAAAARGFAWVGLVEPTVQEFDAVRREFDLHELAVEDAVSAHQRPKLEIYGDTLFLVIKTVRYLAPSSSSTSAR